VRRGLRPRGDSGSALVEFTFLGVLLLVPLVYVLLTAFALQRAAFALTGAAREAGRVFVLADSSDAAVANAQAAARIAMLDQGVDPDSVTFDVECAAAPCLTPGARVDVSLRTVVRLPMVPSFIQGPRGIPVTTRQTVVVDVYRQARP
jgi:hypothetical protein